MAHVRCRQTAGQIKMPLSTEVDLGQGHRLLCLSCLSVLSVTLVYCGQTVGWINMKLGMVVDWWASAQATLLDGNPAPPKRGGGTAPNFRPMSIVVKRLEG